MEARNPLYPYYRHIDAILSSPDNSFRKFQVSAALTKKLQELLAAKESEEYRNCTTQDKMLLLFFTGYLVQDLDAYVQTNHPNCKEQEEEFSTNLDRMDALLEDLLKDSTVTAEQKISMNFLVGVVYDSIKHFFTAKGYYKVALESAKKLDTTTPTAIILISNCLIKLCHCYYAHGFTENIEGKAPELAWSQYTNTIKTALTHPHKISEIYYYVMLSNEQLARLCKVRGFSTSTAVGYVVAAIEAGIQGLETNRTPEQKAFFLTKVKVYLERLYPLIVDKKFVDGEQIEKIQSAINTVNTNFFKKTELNSDVFTSPETVLIDKLKEVINKIEASINPPIIPDNGCVITANLKTMKVW